MRAFGLIAVSALALSACGKKDEAPVADAAASGAAVAASSTAAPDPAAMAGDYAVFDASGKQVMTSTLNADGTYRDVPTKGLAVAGVWQLKDGKTCFDPSGKDPEECFTESARGADGSFTVTDAKGGVMTVKPIKK
jgi:hypothetical protein